MNSNEIENLRRMFTHKQGVALLLTKVCNELMTRACKHDASKILEEDLNRHLEATQKRQELREKHGAAMDYGHEMYKKYRDEYKDLPEEHARLNRHHVEHHKNGIWDMDLVDVLEMLLDWCQAAEDNGEDVEENNSIGKNAKEYGFEPQLTCILRNTVRNLRRDYKNAR